MTGDTREEPETMSPRHEICAIERTAGTAGQAAIVSIVVALLATGAAAGAIYQTVRIGDSGAQAVWKGSVTK